MAAALAREIYTGNQKNMFFEELSLNLLCHTKGVPTPVKLDNTFEMGEVLNKEEADFVEHFKDAILLSGYMGTK